MRIYLLFIIPFFITCSKNHENKIETTQTTKENIFSPHSEENNEGCTIKKDENTNDINFDKDKKKSKKCTLPKKNNDFQFETNN